MRARVLPAYAGMILADFSASLPSVGAPRVCGDDPWEGLPDTVDERCSPRMRG